MSRTQHRLWCRCPVSIKHHYNLCFTRWRSPQGPCPRTEYCPRAGVLRGPPCPGELGSACEQEMLGCSPCTGSGAQLPPPLFPKCLKGQLGREGQGDKRLHADGRDYHIANRCSNLKKKKKLEAAGP